MARFTIVSAPLLFEDTAKISASKAGLFCRHTFDESRAPFDDMACLPPEPQRLRDGAASFDAVMPR